MSVYVGLLDKGRIAEAVLGEGVGLGNEGGRRLGSSERNGQEGGEVGGSKLAESAGSM